MARDLSAFTAICADYRTAIAEARRLRAANERIWADNGWRRAYENYWSLRTAAPSSVDAESWMRETHPEEQSIIDAIDAHSLQHRRAAEDLANRISALVLEALASLADALAPELDRKAQDRRDETLLQLMDEIYVEASALRRQHLDGRRVDFDPEGPFTLGVLAPIADRLGVDRRSRRWIAATVEAHSSTVAMTP